jgi:predicted ATPase with chaperone activity
MTIAGLQDTAVKNAGLHFPCHRIFVNLVPATAHANGFERMFVPEVDAPEADLIPDFEIISVKSLADLFDHLSGYRLVEPYLPSIDSL